MKLDVKQTEKFLQFMNKYGVYYPNEAYDYIMKWYSSLSDEAEADIIRQIYAYSNILLDDNNLYIGFSKMLSERFNINTDILEIAGGFIPVLSKYIDDMQNNGSITVYDPRIIVTSLGNVKLIKDYFNEDTNIDNYNLICALYPCEATVLTLKKSCEKKKNFMIGLCGCNHLEYNIEIPMLYQWENYVYNIAKNTIDENCELEIVKMKRKYNNPYPVIIGKQKNAN